MKSKKYAVADKDRCVACGACVQECPRQYRNPNEGGKI